jgi:amidophosphoribosyltransferase
VTPVGEEYFKHMEQMRGEAKKLKVLDGARQAVRFGVAGAEQVRMAAHGVDVTEQGEVVAAGDKNVPRVNGAKVKSVGAAEAPGITRGDSQDMSMHNFNDYGSA